MQEQDFRAGQDFVLAIKKRWTTQLYPRLHDKVKSAAKAGTKGLSLADIEALLERDIDYQIFAWLERHLQKMKYSGPYGLDPYHAERADQLKGQLQADGADDRLVLDRKFAQPAYYQAVDIHQQPGGVWSHEMAGLVYERGARTTTPMMGQRHRDLHQRFTDQVLAKYQQLPDQPQILDLGCGFGKSTRPFWESLPDAHITGIDLAAPCLRLAAAEAARAGRENIQFRQADARDTGCLADSQDLVTSTMLLHEMPVSGLREMLRESHAVLKPGGWAVHLDFWLLRDAFDRFIFNGHSQRNNEPFMRALLDLDIKAEARAAGFEAVELTAFAEAEGIEPESWPHWRFPWTVIAMQKPAGNTPA